MHGEALAFHLHSYSALIAMEKIQENISFMERKLAERKEICQKLKEKYPDLYEQAEKTLRERLKKK